MSRADAIAILSSRLAGAPNHADYCAWMDRQSDNTLVRLATLQTVHEAE